MARYILEVVLEKVGVHIEQTQKLILKAKNEAGLWEDKIKRAEKKQNFFLFASAVKG